MNRMRINRRVALAALFGTLSVGYSVGAPVAPVGAADITEEAIVFAWPNDELLKLQAKGETLPLVELGRFPVINGSLVLSGPKISRMASDRARIVSRSGRVNLLVAPVNAFGSVGRSMNVDGVLGSPIRVGRRMSVSDSAPRASAAGRVTSCSETLEQTWTDIRTVVGEMWPGPNAKAAFTYSTNAESTLGIGISPSGTYGSWSLKGTKTKTATTSLEFPVVQPGTAKIWQTDFAYGKYRVRCNLIIGSTVTEIVNERQARVSDWEGGTFSYSPVTPAATYCKDYLKGAKLTRTTGTATTLTNGVGISRFLGVDLSSKTGFTTNAQAVYQMTANGKLCGTDAQATSSGRVVGK